MLLYKISKMELTTVNALSPAQHSEIQYNAYLAYYLCPQVAHAQATSIIGHVQHTSTQDFVLEETTLVMESVVVRNLGEMSTHT